MVEPVMHFDRVGSPFCWGGPLGPIPNAAQDDVLIAKTSPQVAPNRQTQAFTTETGDES